MRVQLNNKIYQEFSANTIISFGDCNGENTFEVDCELPENFENTISSFEAIVKNNKVIEILKTQ